MHISHHLAALVLSALATLSLALPTSSTHQLPITFQNEASEPMCAFIVGRDIATDATLFLDAATSTWFTPDASSAGQTFGCDSNLAVRVPAGNGTHAVALPGYLTGARVWLGYGLSFGVAPGGGIVQPSPADASTWQIVEFSSLPQQTWADISYIDQIGVPVGLYMTGADGNTLAAPGLPAGAKETICDYLDGVGEAWGSLCVRRDDGSVVRIFPPGYASGLANLFDDYVEQVWTRFRDETLTIDTQMASSGPFVTCQVQGDLLVCTHPDGAAYSYARPTTQNILSCTGGPFEEQAAGDELHKRTRTRLCAAFTRTTLLLEGGELTPSAAVGSDRYYTSSAANHFAKAVHDALLQAPHASGAYTSPMDDVNAVGENQSGTLAVDSAGASMKIVIREP